MPDPFHDNLVRSLSLSRQRRMMRVASALLAGVLLVSLFGCGPLGFLAHGVAGGERRVKVEPAYTKLADQRIAVLVAADSYMLHQYGGAPGLITRNVSLGIAEHVPNTRFVKPDDVADYQMSNPYWTTRPYSEALEALDVDRLIIVDLMDFRLHEPGNAHVWNGLAAANVLIVEREARDPDNPTFSTTVQARFPEESKLGMVDENADREAIQTSLTTRFARNIARLFYEHERYQ